MPLTSFPNSGRPLRDGDRHLHLPVPCADTSTYRPCAHICSSSMCVPRYIYAHARTCVHTHAYTHTCVRVMFSVFLHWLYFTLLLSLLLARGRIKGQRAHISCVTHRKTEKGRPALFMLIHRNSDHPPPPLAPRLGWGLPRDRGTQSQGREGRQRGTLLCCHCLFFWP